LTGPGGPLTAAPADGALRVDVPLPERTDHIELRSRGFTSTGTNDVLKHVTALLNDAQIGFALKERLLSSVETFGQQGAASWSAIGAVPTGHAPVIDDYDIASPELLSAMAESVGAA